MSLQGMRAAFQFPGKQTTHWFPGHMAKGLRLMQVHLSRVDCVVEVHDARLSNRGRNPHFHLLRECPKVIVHTKADLAGLRPGSTSRGGALRVDCTEAKAVSLLKIVPKVLSAVPPEALQRDPPFLRLMVAGLPNVGKSSLINGLRRMFSGRGKAARVGARPGVTRALQTDIKIHEAPPVYMVDTPGVMVPSLDDPELAMQLALIGTLRDELVGIELIADFALFTLNRKGVFEYVPRFRLPHATDDISELLHGVARRIGALNRGGAPNLELAATHFVRAYRDGNLGRFQLTSCHDIT